jgi:hypothetical protein
MNTGTEHPFHSIESAHEFMALLSATVVEAKHELELDIAREESNPSRRLDVLRVALYNLEKLESDINRSRRRLNDLRTLRRLLFDERSGVSSLSSPLESTRSQSMVAA